jgi:hypothetical protein
MSHPSQIIMRSTGNLHMSDVRRISPQTTSSSGYHSDLSSATSTNQSPQSIHEILPTTLEKSHLSPLSSVHSQQKSLNIANNSTYGKPVTNKNLSRLSSFLRRQYERARSKLSMTTTTFHSHPKTYLSQAPVSNVVATCSKATSTTPLSHLSDEHYKYPTKQQQYASSNQNAHYLTAVYKQSSFTEPVS